MTIRSKVSEVELGNTLSNFVRLSARSWTVERHNSQVGISTEKCLWRVKLVMAQGLVQRLYKVVGRSRSRELSAVMFIDWGVFDVVEWRLIAECHLAFGPHAKAWDQ